MTRNPITGKKTLLNDLYTLNSNSSLASILQDIERKYEPVLNLVCSAVVIIQAETARVLWFNQAFSSLTGFREDEAVGRQVFEFLPPAEANRLRNNLTEFTSLGQQQSKEYIIRSKAGKMLTVTGKGNIEVIQGQKVIVASLNNVTHQRQVRKELEESAFETTSLINSIDTFLWSMDRDYKFKRVNTAAYQMFQRSFGLKAEPGETYKRALEVLPENSTRIWNEHLTHVFETAKEVHFEISEVINHRFTHINAKVQPIVKNGQVEEVSVHVENDTQVYLRHRLIEVLDDFKTKIIGVDDHEKLLWLVTDEILAKLDFEDALILWVEEDKLVAKTAHGAKRVGKNDVSPLVLNLGEGITGAVAKSGKTEIINDTRLDARYLSRHFIALSEIAVPIVIDDDIVGVINCESQHVGFFTPSHQEILQEVAELVGAKMKMLLADRGLKEMQMLNRAVLDSTPSSFLLLDPETRIRSFNHTARQMFSTFFDVEIALGDDFEQYVPPRYIKIFEDLFEIALGGKIKKTETPLEHPQLGETWLAMTFAPAYNQDKEIFGVTLIVEDITQKKKSQDLIIRQNEELKKANKELDKFVYSVSHDLRSPIANVMGLTTIIEASEKISEVKEYSAMIENTMTRMDAFIHNILDYSRNNRLEVRDDRLCLHELVEELILDYYHIESVKGIEIRNNVSKDLYLDSDGQRLRMILGNLLSNAIKYSDPEKDDRFVSVSAERENAMLKLKVADNGQGIEAKHLPNLFQMFYTANLRAQGSGIGLYILQDAVNHLGGSVDVTSEIGKGTEFNIRIPIRTKE